MAHRVTWSQRALQDLESIAGYIAADSPAYASIVVKKIVNQTRMLAVFPLMGHRVPEFDDDGVRELLVYSYRVIYRVEPDQVVIAAIIHGKRILR